MSKAIYAALAAIQCGAVVVKRNKNETLNSKFADLADVRNFLDPQLKEHGLVISFVPGPCREVMPGKMVQTLTLEIVHLETGEVMASHGEYPVPEGNRAVTSAQAYGSSLTYAMRYALVARFGLITGDDDDAQRARANVASAGIDAPPQASDTAHWKLLMDGHWTDTAAPDGSGRALVDVPAQERAALAKRFPEHAALTAWVAERLEATLAELGLDWPQFCERAGGSWPESMFDCTGAQVRAAAAAAKTMLTSTK